MEGFQRKARIAMQYIYTMLGVSKVVPPNRTIIKDISLSFFPGAKIGLLGLNGAGKSTVLRIMAGVDKDFIGEARPQPGIKIGYLPQEPELDPNKTVREVVEEGVAEVLGARKRLEEIYAAYAEPDADFDKLAEEQARLEALLASTDAHALEHQLEVAADALNLPPWDAKIAHLSGGEKRRVALCRLLLSKPDMLLLDEPTNHLDAESVAWLEHYLQQFPGTVVAVTHDRYFLDNAAEWILELDRGHGIPWKGNYSSWLEQKELRLKQEEAAEKARRKAIERELEWVRQKGKRGRNKARLARFEELNSVEFQRRNETNEIYIPPGERLGDKVIEFHNVTKVFGDRVLIENLSFSVPPGAIVGIIGPNGAGKSTLFRMIVGQDKPDAGEIVIGPTVKLAYVDQTRSFSDPNRTVWEEISGGADFITVGNYQTPSRAYVGRFNFKGPDQQKRVGQLSGGERGRLHLAKTLMQGGNVLLLDEPSNDLDVETLRALEEALLAFPGSALVISHDRWFLDRIATHILAFEGEGRVVFFPGNFTEYEEDKVRRLGEEAARPKRFRFKKLA
ncbi:MAG: energy-dependent translational throttle protein EttA [Lysobacterales bacterium]|jgi:ATP-binding cassette ChvD family protein|nr:MAG: energy-dependent translational throttle protein EttA [Xanthomonadales bacterium]